MLLQQWELSISLTRLGTWSRGQCSYHKVTTQLICNANRLAGFYMIETLTLTMLNANPMLYFYTPENVKKPKVFDVFRRYTNKSLG